jgi:hypothetical protein
MKSMSGPPGQTFESSEMIGRNYRGTPFDSDHPVVAEAFELSVHIESSLMGQIRWPNRVICEHAGWNSTWSIFGPFGTLYNLASLLVVKFLVMHTGSCLIVRNSSSYFETHHAVFGDTLGVQMTRTARVAR